MKKKIVKNIIILLLIIAMLVIIVLKLVNIKDGKKFLEASHKLNDAIQRYAADDNLSLEEAIKQVEGYQEMRDIGDGLYEVVIDGQTLLMEHREVTPEE